MSNWHLRINKFHGIKIFVVQNMVQCHHVNLTEQSTHIDLPLQASCTIFSVLQTHHEASSIILRSLLSQLAKEGWYGDW